MTQRSLRLTALSALALLVATVIVGCTSKPKSSAPDIKAIGEAAYVYGYPLVLMDVTRQAMTAVPRVIPEKAAPVNQFLHKNQFPDASFTDVVSPNADTYYSIAFLDVAAEPMLLTLPDFKGRYYLMPMLDGWTNVFASPGKRTTGTGAGTFAVVGPGWQGSLPKDVHELRSPTDMVWIIGRSQVNSKADGNAVIALQKQITLAPLSAWGKPAKPPADVPVEPATALHVPPATAVEQMDATNFFTRLAKLMITNPPALEDSAALASFAVIGLVPGKEFDPSALGPDQKALLDAAPAAAMEKIKGAAQSLGGRVVNGWAISTGLGDFGTDYMKRAGTALFGLGANLSEDAVYPHTRVDADGAPLNGANRYVLHFAKGQLPPVHAFWSLTMYNDKQLFVANPINRYAIGDRSDLHANADGSVDLYLQRDDPGAEKTTNWLPSPAETFNLVLRLYWPKDTAIDGTWQPPAVTKVP